jgi:hypothetical protein
MQNLSEIDKIRVKELDGEVLSLNGIRTIENQENKIEVSQAILLVRTQFGLKKGQMLFWNSDAHQIKKLVLGKHYHFEAAVTEYEDKLLLFFLPRQTIFVDQDDGQWDRSL